MNRKRLIQIKWFNFRTKFEEIEKTHTHEQIIRFIVRVLKKQNSLAAIGKYFQFAKLNTIYLNTKFLQMFFLAFISISSSYFPLLDYPFCWLNTHYFRSFFISSNCILCIMLIELLESAWIGLSAAHLIVFHICSINVAQSLG